MIDFLGSWPIEMQIGIILIVASWFIFMITMPSIKRVIQRRWRKLKAEQCRRKQKTFLKILIWSHVLVVFPVVLALDYSQNNIEFGKKYVETYLPYYFVAVSFLIIMQVLYEAMKGYVVGRFGPDPIEPKWYQCLNFIASLLQSCHKKIQRSAIYNRVSIKLKLQKLIVRRWIHNKISEIKNLF